MISLGWRGGDGYEGDGKGCGVRGDSSLSEPPSPLFSSERAVLRPAGTCMRGAGKPAKRKIRGKHKKRLARGNRQRRACGMCVLPGGGEPKFGGGKHKKRLAKGGIAMLAFEKLCW